MYTANQYFPVIQDASGCLRAACTTIVKLPTYVPGQFTLACDNCVDLTSAYSVITQKRIQRTVRTCASAYAESLVPQHVYDPALLAGGGGNTVIWNQASDRAVAGVVARNVPSRGASSVHGSITRARPGATSAPGSGVDIKHGSYARYLAKLKGRTVARPCAPAPAVAPLRGNKTQYYSIASPFSCSTTVG